MRKPSHAISQATLSFCLALYVGGMLNAAVLYRHSVSGSLTEFFGTGLAALAVIALTYALFSLLALAGQWTYRLGTSLVLLFSAAASYYMTFFNVVIGYGVVISVLTTDTDLSKEALGYKFFIWMACTALLPILGIFRARLSHDFYSQVRGRWRGVPALSLLLLSIAISISSLKAIETIKKNQASAKNEYIASPSGIVAHSYLPTNWMAGLGLYFFQMVNGDRTSHHLLNPAKIFKYAESTPMDDTYVVFIIGETTRSDHVGLLGYHRNTTPLLAKETNLVALNGIACDTATKLSLRCMFVREGGVEDNAQRTLKERNIFAVLKALGFTSELFSMQSEVWFYNSIDADSYEIREVIASANVDKNKPTDDMLLVDELEKSINRYPKGKHLIVLHTKGSHFLYSQRYPAEFSRYVPECTGIDAACTKAQLVNSFDNSVLYVDHVMKRTIDTLREKDAIIFYAADHGESIGEASHFHATPRAMAPEEQFKVPFFVWASDRFLDSPGRAAGFAQLRAMQMENKRQRHEELFDSVLGCLGYSSPDGGINPRNNWCHTKSKMAAHGS